MGEVVHLNVPPKSITGSRHNKTYVITYVPAIKQWSWEVTVHLTPQVYKGTAPTQVEAQKEVDKYLR